MEDFDGDGLTNWAEMGSGTNPKVADTDEDGLSDGAEALTHLTNPLSADTDSDGMPDGWELAHGLHPLEVADAGADADVDGLTNRLEYENGTDPNESDTDGDELLDGAEVLTHLTSPLSVDTDGEGLPDGWEVQNGLSPLSDGGLALGLAARWRLDEGAGMSVSNQVSIQWTAVLRNMSASNWVAGGPAGKGLWLDGVSNFVSVSQSGGAVVTGAPFTVMARVWQEADAPDGNPTLFSDGALLGGGQWPGWVLRYEQFWNRLVGYAGDPNQPMYGVSQTNWLPANSGRWFNVVMTHDGTRARLFVDGRQGQSAVGAFAANTQSELWIGFGHVNWPNSHWKGMVGDVRIFRAALLANELAAANDWLGDEDEDGLINGREYLGGTDPDEADTDGDGVSDGDEVLTHGTDPLDVDTDGDGMPDGWEIAEGFDPLAEADAVEDADADGLSTLLEFQNGTDPYNPDSDDDGLNDGEEVLFHGTNPLNSDTDGDELPDVWEARFGLDPLDPLDVHEDADGDGLTNMNEYILGTHPSHPDTDGDGMPDGWESSYEFDPLSGMSSELGLRLWLRMDDGSGTNLANSADSTYRGQIRDPSGVAWAAGEMGDALWLDGTAGHAIVPQTTGATVTGTSFTVCAWIWYNPTASASYPTILSDSIWPEGRGIQGYLLRIEENEIVGYVGNSNQMPSKVSASNWAERWGGRWTHVALVQDAGITRLYVDGSLWDQHANTYGEARSPEMRIGKGHVNEADSLWTGGMDEVRVYGTALTGDQLQELFEGRSDANRDGLSNYEAWQGGLNPYTNPVSATTEGALDVQFVPLDWGVEENVQYLAMYRDLQPGHEIHVFVEDDILTFAMMDAEGGRHVIRHPRLVEGGYLMPGATNRITASWRGYNTGKPTMDMRLFVNGIDYRADFGFDYLSTPAMTTSTWEDETGYWNAAFVTSSWNTVVRTNHARFFEWGDGSLTARVDRVDSRVYGTAYGMVSSNPVPPFPVGVKTPPPAGDRPQTLLQSITRPRSAESFVSSNEVRTAVRRYRQVADAVELEIRWMGWANESVTNDWPFFEDHVKTVIHIGNQEGLDVALSSWTTLDAMVAYRFSNSIPGRAERMYVETNGFEARIGLTNAHWQATELMDVPQFDFGNRVSVSNYLVQWRDYLSIYTNYSYFFFNEDALQPGLDPSYLESSTASESSLAWFREYVTNQYGAAFADIRFPVSPLAIGALDVSHAAQFHLVLDDSVTNRLVLTTDPDHWAKWWEWRQVVFANLMAGYAKHLQALNVNNPNWRGIVYFVSPLKAWTPRSGIHLPLLAQIPELNWIVMENSRFGSYGVGRMEEEIQMQLMAAKAATSDHTGFGSYVMAHRYPYPSVTNGVTNATYTLPWIYRDVDLAASPEFQSSIVVPYSDFLLVNRPGVTSDFQNAHYIPEVAEAWNRARFEQLWSPLRGHATASNVIGTTTIQFSWDVVEQAKAYEWEASVSAAFAITNVSVQVSTNRASWSLLTQPVSIATPIHWRTRGVFHVYDYSDSGEITGTNVYRGVWAASPNPIEVLDSDADDLPDAWEMRYFFSLSQGADGDFDENGIRNLQEYLNGTNPAL